MNSKYPQRWRIGYLSCIILSLWIGSGYTKEDDIFSLKILKEVLLKVSGSFDVQWSPKGTYLLVEANDSKDVPYLLIKIKDGKVEESNVDKKIFEDGFVEWVTDDIFKIWAEDENGKNVIREGESSFAKYIKLSGGKFPEFEVLKETPKVLEQDKHELKFFDHKGIILKQIGQLNHLKSLFVEYKNQRLQVSPNIESFEAVLADINGNRLLINSGYEDCHVYDLKTQSTHDLPSDSEDHIFVSGESKVLFIRHNVGLEGEPEGEFQGTDVVLYDYVKKFETVLVKSQKDQKVERKNLAIRGKLVIYTQELQKSDKASVTLVIGQIQ